MASGTDNASPSQGGAPAQREKSNNRADETVVIRPLPKVIFFFPLCVVSLICGILPLLGTVDQELIGQLWVGVFALNLLVISADFDENKSLIALFAAVAGVALALYLDVLGSVLRLLGSVKPTMNSAFYFCVFALFAIIYAVVLVRTRYNYWEFGPSEVTHKSGIFSKVKRYSTHRLTFQKEIPDVLEYFMFALWAGRLVITVPNELPIVIEHVPFVDRQDERIRDLLNVSVTTIDNDGSSTD